MLFKRKPKEEGKIITVEESTGVRKPKEEWGIRTVEESTGVSPEILHALNINLKDGENIEAFLDYVAENRLRIASPKDLAKARIAATKTYNSGVEDKPLLGIWDPDLKSGHPIWYYAGQTSLTSVYNPRNGTLYLVKNDLSFFGTASLAKKDIRERIASVWGGKDKRSELTLTDEELEIIVEKAGQNGEVIALRELGSFFTKYITELDEASLEDDKVFNFIFEEASREYIPVFRDFNKQNKPFNRTHVLCWDPKEWANPNADQETWRERTAEPSKAIVRPVYLGTTWIPQAGPGLGSVPLDDMWKVYLDGSRYCSGKSTCPDHYFHDPKNHQFWLAKD